MYASWSTRIGGAEMSDFGQDHDGIVRRMSKGGVECPPGNMKSCDRTPSIHRIVVEEKRELHRLSFLGFKRARFFVPTVFLEFAS